MNTATTFLTTLDHMSNKLQHDTYRLRPIPLIDDYNSYYPDPDYGFVPYWDTSSYNQHHLYFYNIYNQPAQDIEPDSYETDQALNTVLEKARVDQWQYGQTTHSPTDSP